MNHERYLSYCPLSYIILRLHYTLLWFFIKVKRLLPRRGFFPKKLLLHLATDKSGDFQIFIFDKLF